MINVREVNKIRVLKAILDNQPISRASLAKMLNLSRAAVTGITQRLMELGLLQEVGKGDSTSKGGRKEVLLSVKPNALNAISVEIEKDFIKVALINIVAEIRDYLEMENDCDAEPVDVLKEIADQISQMIERNNVSKDQILGIGIALPGIIEYKQGYVREVAVLKKWKLYPIADYLKKVFDLPVFLENNIKALTIGEFHYGIAKEYTDVVVVSIGDGIGSGIILNNGLVRGYFSSAGEIGYNENIPKKELRPIIVGEDCKDWGDILSHNNLIKSINRGIDKGLETSLKKNSTVEEIIQAGENGDKLAFYVLKKFGEYLASICYNMLLIINPPVLILSGTLFEKSSVFKEALLERIHKGLLRAPIEHVDVKEDSLKDKGAILGVAGIIYDDFFKLPHSSESLTRSTYLSSK